MDVLFDYLERIIICLSPLVIAWFGFRASRNEKQTKKFMESQELLKSANAKLKEKEKQDLQDHFDKLDKSISGLTEQVSELKTSISKISEIDKRIENLVEMSNVNFEFCTSLSAVISSIGMALDSSDAIESGNLQNDLTSHRRKEHELMTRVCKIIY